MELFGGVIRITGITYQLFIVFIVAFLGYLLGRIDIKGVSLGTAGIFITALLFGGLFSEKIHKTMTLSGGDITTQAFAIIENTGLILFIGSVDMMAGPGFFENLKKNLKSYILIGFIIILAGVLSSAVCFYIGLNCIETPADVLSDGITDRQYMISMITGIMSGALTSTPAFSAAKSTAGTLVSAEAAGTLQDALTIGHAIAYIFGVVGVVLFVQLIPRILKADMESERKKIAAEKKIRKINGDMDGSRFKIDPMGFAAFALVVIVGIFVGMIRIPLTLRGFDGTTFSLTTTGGVLICAIVFSHFGNIGSVSLRVDHNVLEVFRELGLVFFLIGAGIPGGASFVKYFHPIYFVFGVFITMIPMLIGYLVMYKLLKRPLLDSLGAITGGMTSTPALGTLIKTAGINDVTSSYASTYPIALICVVLGSQFLILIFGG